MQNHVTAEEWIMMIKVTKQRNDHISENKGEIWRRDLGRIDRLCRKESIPSIHSKHTGWFVTTVEKRMAVNSKDERCILHAVSKSFKSRKAQLSWFIGVSLATTISTEILSDCKRTKSKWDIFKWPWQADMKAQEFIKRWYESQRFLTLCMTPVRVSRPSQTIMVLKNEYDWV